MTLLRLLSRTKLYWGLAAIFLIGVLTSPVSSKGNNIFLSYGNLLDVLRQVSITGLIATGMTAVIITAGIDLSVGSIMALCSVVCAMLLTVEGWTPAAAMGLPAAAITVFVVLTAATRFLLRQRPQAGSRGRAGSNARPGLAVPAVVGLAGAGAALAVLLPQVATKFGVLGVLLVTPCVGLMVGAINGIVIVGGRLQPFIVTLAMMVTALGVARLTAGQNNAVLPVYTGSNAVAEFDVLRSLVFGVVPVPGLFFLAAVLVYGAVLRFTTFGRYVYAIGGNEEAARLSGIDVARTKIATYAISGLLAGVAAVLFVAQYRQGKPDAGAGLELDAIAAVVIGGTSLMGGRGRMAGTLVGVLIFGLLSNLLQLHNINSNLQLVLKGLIIVGAVLIQERNLGEFMANLRLARPGRRGRNLPRGRGRKARPGLASLEGAHDATSKLPEGGGRNGRRPDGHGLPARGLRPGAGQEVGDRLQPGHDHRAVAGAVQQGHHRRGREAPGCRADHHRRRGPHREAGRRRREPDPPGGRRALDLAEGVGGPHRGGRAGDRRRHPGVRARPQRRDRPLHPVRRRRQRADRQGGRRVDGRGARRRGQGGGQCRRDLGGLGTQPAHDRHDGFHELTDKEPGIKYLLNEQSGDWKQDQAYDIMATALRSNEDIDLVYGHNDPMAYGAYLAAKDVGREGDIKFIGIDALPGEGVMWVHNGELAATFLYATPGAEGLRQALKHLNGEEVPKAVVLDTMTVTKENAEEILKANGLM